MKLFRFDGGRIGMTLDHRSLDVTDALGVNTSDWPPVQMVQLIANFERMDGIARHPKVREIDLAAVRLEVPIEWPNKLLAYPVNYVKHGEEMNSTNRADRNGFFLKANSSLSGPRDDIVLPDLPGREIHHECELGIVIGKQGKHISREAAFDHVFGYACLIDMVVRGNEERVMRKSYDTFCPFGPWITTADVLATMESYSNALTAQCTTCHVAGSWADESRQNKSRARIMQTMVNAINADHIPKMQMSGAAQVTCMTCHRGLRTPNQAIDAGLQKQNEVAKP